MYKYDCYTHRSRWGNLIRKDSLIFGLKSLDSFGLDFTNL